MFRARIQYHMIARGLPLLLRAGVGTKAGLFMFCVPKTQNFTVHEAQQLYGQPPTTANRALPRGGYF